MTVNAFVQVGLYMVLLLALAKPMGGYMARVYPGHLEPATPGDTAERHPVGGDL